MAGDPKNPKIGDLVIDVTELAPVLVDLPPGALQGMLATQDGFGDVAKEIADNQPSVGVAAGVMQEDVDDIQSSTDTIAKIDRFLRPVAKLYEVLTETRAREDNKRQRKVLTVAESVDRRAYDNPELLAKYDKTRAYRSAAGKKAWKTRRKNAAAKTPQDAPK